MNFLAKAACAMVLLVPVAACGSHPDPEPNGDPPVAASKEPAPDVGGVSTLSGGGRCCDYGFFTCSFNHKIFEYDTVNCGPTKPAQQAACEASCLHLFGCSDSGWVVPNHCSP